MEATRPRPPAPWSRISCPSPLTGAYADVTIEEAQAAVLLATTVVGWLSKGMLRRK